MSDPSHAQRSAIKGQVWPPMPGAHGARLAALLYQFERSERLPPAALLGCQMSQLDLLLAYARHTVAYYRDTLADITTTRPLTLEQWQTLPLLTRRDVQSAGDSLNSTAVPAEFGALHVATTSGSTGEPVRIRRSAVDQLMWEALTLREYYWHGHDFKARLASIRVFDNNVGAAPHGTFAAQWGGPASALHDTGSVAMLALDTDIALQAAWLRRHDPEYLTTYPTNLAALLDHAATAGWSLPCLRVVRTVGETVSTELRERCEKEWGVPLIDVYSSRELGYIALQCPHSGWYHVTGESVLVEVLDDLGHAVAAGGVGRIVVSVLHNYATPLIRYELNDYAEVGPPCACGRGLPTLRRILGRSRNMVQTPDGRRYWPRVGFAHYRDIAPIRQYQLVQTAIDRITVKLVVDRPPHSTEQARLASVIRAALRYPFTLDFEYPPERIGRGPGGKYEEFISLLGPPAQERHQGRT